MKKIIINSGLTKADLEKAENPLETLKNALDRAFIETVKTTVPADLFSSFVVKAPRIDKDGNIIETTERSNTLNLVQVCNRVKRACYVDYSPYKAEDSEKIFAVLHAAFPTDKAATVSNTAICKAVDECAAHFGFAGKCYNKEAKYFVSAIKQESVKIRNAKGANNSRFLSADAAEVKQNSIFAASLPIFVYVFEQMAIRAEIQAKADKLKHTKEQPKDEQAAPNIIV